MTLWQRLFRRSANPKLPAHGKYGWSFMVLGSRADTRPIATPEDQLKAFVGWSYAAGTVVAADVRAASWQLWRKGGKDRKTWKPEDENAPFVQLMSKPNALQTWGDFAELSVIHLRTTGTVFWRMLQNGSGKLLGLQVIYPHWVKEPVIREGRLAAWRVQVPGWAHEDIPADEVVFLRYPHPYEPLMGMSPIEAYATAHDFDLYLRAYGSSMLRNDSGVPAGIITSDQELTPSQAEYIRERWVERYGGERGRFGPAVLGRGSKYQPIAIPIGDIKYMELGRFNRDLILAAHRVPAFKLGLLEDSNRANSVAAENSYRASSVLPDLNRIQQAINQTILRKFFGYEAYKYFFEFDDIMLADAEQQHAQAKSHLELGAISINEYRTAHGLTPVEGGDVIAGIAGPERAVQEALAKDAGVRAAKSKLRAILGRAQKALRTGGFEAVAQEWLEATGEVLNAGSVEELETLKSLRVPALAERVWRNHGS